MTISTITGTVAGGVTLGTGNYALELTVAADGAISGAVYGAPSVSTSSLINFGSIGGPLTIIKFTDGGYIYNAGRVGEAGVSGTGMVLSDVTLINAGTIGVLGEGVGVLADSEGQGSVQNSGTIYGDQIGIVLGTGLINSGAILGQIAIDDESGGIVNDGTIYGAGWGILDATGTVTNAGTIGGGSFAIYANAALALITDPGAVFDGAVEDKAGTGTLVLGGTSAGRLDISSFSGFGGISFAPGATWALEGGAAQLAAGEVISGLSPNRYVSYSYTGIPFTVVRGDQIILDGFAASTESFVSGIGLILSNGSASETLNITGPVMDFHLSTDGVNTTIAPQTSTISAYRNFSYGAVTLGSRAYASSLTITNTGTVGNNQDFGFGGAVDGSGTLVNEGAVMGQVALGSGTVINSGFINWGVDLDSGLVVDSGMILAPGDNLPDAISAQSSLTVILQPGASVLDAMVDADGEGTLVLESVSLIRGIDTDDFQPDLSGFHQISFAGGDNTLYFGDPVSFGNGITLDGFGYSDTLQLASSDSLQFGSAAALAASYVAGAGIVISEGSVSTTMALSGGVAGDKLQFTTLSNQGEIEVTAACFCRGTRIATPHGEVPVEKLAIGDEVLTLHSGTKRIKWIGRRAYAAPFASGDFIRPLRIRPGAFGEDVPRRALNLSPGHALFVDGALIPAWRLLNGASVIQATHAELVEYFHIELDTQELIFAEACPAESFIGASQRGQFRNAREFGLLYPDDEDQAPCLPLLEDGFVLEAIKARVAQRAGLPPAPPGAMGALRGFVDVAGPVAVEGWAQDEAAPEAPVALDILRAGQRIGRVLANHYRADLRAAGLGSGCHGFRAAVPPGEGGITVRRCADGAMLPLTEQAAHVA